MTATGLFITATDTGVGKTTIARWLIPVLEKNNLSLCIRKPVETGCLQDASHPTTLLPQDAICLANASIQKPKLEEVCPYRFKAISSPARAAQLTSSFLSIQELVDACQTDSKDFLLVEGAGGFYSPLASDGLNADLAQALDIPLLLVVENRLGCINHTLLILEVAEKRELSTIAVVLNQTRHNFNHDINNFDELSDLTTVPVIQTFFSSCEEKEKKNSLAIQKITKLLSL